MAGSNAAAEPGDRRVKRVYLTPEAERVHKRIWRVAEETVDARWPIFRAGEQAADGFAAAHQEDAGVGG